MKNVIDLLKFLGEGENYLIKVNNYNRIGNKTTDEFDMFERKEVAVPTPFELIGNENRLNISIQNKIYGVVTLNPKQAKRVDLPTTINGPMIYRTKTIIKDGQLNIEELEIIVDTATYLKLKKNNIPFTQLVNDTNYPGFKILLDLSGMPIADGGKTDYTLDEILENVTNINILKAKQRVLNSLTKELPSDKEEAIPGYTEEQSAVLRDHGLDEKLQYIGVANVLNETEETYVGETMEFKVKGSSMSSFKIVLNRVKNGDKLNALDQVQYDFSNELAEKITSMELKDAEDIKTFYKSELRKIKGELFSIKLRNTAIKLVFMASPMAEVAFDMAGTFNYKGSLTIVRKGQEFTK